MECYSTKSVYLSRYFSIIIFLVSFVIVCLVVYVSVCSRHSVCLLSLSYIFRFTNTRSQDLPCNCRTAKSRVTHLNETPKLLTKYLCSSLRHVYSFYVFLTMSLKNLIYLLLSSMGVQISIIYIYFCTRNFIG